MPVPDSGQEPDYGRNEAGENAAEDRLAKAAEHSGPPQADVLVMG